MDLSEIENKIIAKCVKYYGYTPFLDIKKVDENTYTESLIKNDGSGHRLNLTFKIDIKGNVNIL